LSEIPTFRLSNTVWEVTAALESAKAEIGSYRTIVVKSDTDAARAKA
jgi:hypothetical protein